MRKNRKQLKSLGYYLDEVPVEVVEAFSTEIAKIVREKLRLVSLEFPPKTCLSCYHRFITDYEHSRIWNKESRLFKYDFISQPVIQNWLEGICKKNNKAAVLDVEGLGYPELYFRIVRPKQLDDVFGAHSDGPFFSFANGVLEETWSKWLKIWMPICFESSNNTLGFFPKSMLVKPTFEPTQFDDKIRPTLKEDASKFGQISFPIKKIGQLVVFSPRVLHQAINQGANHTRVSIEFAIG